MARYLYSLLYYCLTPLFFLRLIIKHKKSKYYKNQRQDLRLAERLGFFDIDKFKRKNNNPAIVIHTVYVGEFIASLPLIKSIQKNYPQFPIVISCTTTTGSAQIIKTFKQEISDNTIFHVYLAYDLPGSMQRFLTKIKPQLVLIMETEIWPNLLHYCQQYGINTCLVNARLSERSAKGYARFAKLSNEVLQNFNLILAQNNLDAQRLIKLGASADQVFITGSIKFDIQLKNEDISKGHLLRKKLNWLDKKVLIAASTHQGEDEQIYTIFTQLRQTFPDCVLIIVPRHPERFSAVYQLLNDGKYQLMKRSRLKGSSKKTIDILLGDTMGEMIQYFSCADIVFMGGTLVATGGHNILEPAAMSLAIIYGPHMFNFQSINDLFLTQQAAIQVEDSEKLLRQLKVLLGQTTQAQEMGKKARQIIDHNTGSVDRIMTHLHPFLSTSKNSTHKRPPQSTFDKEE